MSNAEVASPTDASDAAESVPRSGAADVIMAAAAIAAVAGLFSGQQPTGTSWWDPLLTALVAVGFTVAAAVGNGRALFVAAAIATLGTGLSPWMVAGVAACAAFAGAERLPARRPQLRAVAGALAVIGLFHLEDFGVFGLSAAIAAVAILAVLIDAMRQIGGGARASAMRVVYVVAALIGVVLLIAAIMALATRGTVNTGIEAARSAIAAARSGDTATLASELAVAQESLASADGRASSPLLTPLYLVPVASQHLRAVATSTEHAAVVAEEARAAAEEGNIEDFELRQGAVDLDGLEAIAPRLNRAAVELRTASRAISDARTPWLIGAVDARIEELLGEVLEVQDDADLAAQAAAVVPRMLGSEGERRYLLLFGSPGEAREFGGFVGGYAVLGVDDGRLDLVSAGSINDLVPIANLGALQNPASYPVEFVAADPVTFPQNLTSTPSIETIARAVRDVFPELFDAPIDGVVYLDPYALAALTELSGPIEVDGIDGTLIGDDIVEFIFDGQYRLFDGREERFTAIGELAKATAAAFADADLPGPEELGRLLGPEARGGRLQVITYDDAENDFLTAVKLQRHFAAPEGIDSVAVVHANATASKLDLYLHRSVRYDVTVDGEQLSATVDVELTSAIPDDAPELTYGFTDGTNEVLLTLYSPHRLVQVTVDDVPHEFVAQQEFGFARYGLFTIEVPANSSRSVRFELEGEAPPGPYRLGVWQQPLVHDDQVELVHRNRSGEVVSTAQTLVEGVIFEPASVGVGD